MNMAAAVAPLRARGDVLRQRAANVRMKPAAAGRVVAYDGAMMSVVGLDAGVGDLVRIGGPAGGSWNGGSPRMSFLAEVLGFRDDRLLLLPLDPGATRPGAIAVRAGRADMVPAGPGLLGRVVDGMGHAIDGLGPLVAERSWPISGVPLAPLCRGDVVEPMWTGVRAIDALLTMGVGQRIGLIAGSGVGKTQLMRDLVRNARADAVVVGLIGERGREIAAFVGALDPAMRARCHVVAVPADHPARLKVRGAERALAIAESLRATGSRVLLLLDSLTRVAHAQRELGAAIGEPVGARGYTASAIAMIPRLVERAGNDVRTGGAITAVMTVLADGDDVISDPVVDAARGVMDGHVILSRELAARGRFPAIDLRLSVSRTMAACVEPWQLAAATRLRTDLALLESTRELVSIGAHVPGADPQADRVLAAGDAIEAFLRQPADAMVDPTESLAALQALVAP